MKKQWWHDKAAYQIYPMSFKDSNGDGVGDLRGIISKLDYLKDLGVEIIWISPIYPSPLADNGYDIADYYSIDPRFGTMEDMDELLVKAKEQGMYILMDLVVNHCSDQHEWFRKALADPDGEYADYFYFKEGKDGNPPNNWRSYFGGSVWEPVPGTDKYYLHLFHKGQPDLNWENQKVRREIYDMINWWLEKGIAGYRIDAIINIKKDLSFQDYPVDGPDGLSSINHMLSKAVGVGELLEELKHETFEKYDAFTIGEVFNMKEGELEEFIGDDGHFSCQFDFEHVCVGASDKGWYDDRKADFVQWRDAIFQSQRKTEGVGFLSNIIENHDEPRGASTYLPEQDWCYESVTALAATTILLRGLPFLYQGQELGMTNCPFQSITEYNDISTLDQYDKARAAGLNEEEALKAVYGKSRDHCRTMMQWDDSANAGFTDGTPWFKVNPNYKEINAAAEERAEKSILKFYRQLLALRKSEDYREVFTYGSLIPVGQESNRLFGYLRKADHKTVAVLGNYSKEDLVVEAVPAPGNILLNNYDDLLVVEDRVVLKPYQVIVTVNLRA